MRFEIWLMWQNEKIKKSYWELLKGTKCNDWKNTMSKYRILEIIILEKPNFEDLNNLSKQIKKNSIDVVKEINNCLIKNNK